MKKRKWLRSLLAVLVLWLAMTATDLYRVTHEFERPLFCILVNGADDGGSGTYIGLGYAFEIKGNFMPEDAFPGVTKYELKILAWLSTAASGTEVNVWLLESLAAALPEWRRLWPRRRIPVFRWS